MFHRSLFNVLPTHLCFSFLLRGGGGGGQGWEVNRELTVLHTQLATRTLRKCHYCYLFKSRFYCTKSWTLNIVYFFTFLLRFAILTRIRNDVRPRGGTINSRTRSYHSNTELEGRETTQREIQIRSKKHSFPVALCHA